jgi:hypothetical protein
VDRVEEPIKILASVAVPPLSAQVTKVDVGGKVAYVRENVRDGKNVLELAAPEESWAKIAAIILVEDDLKREIHKSVDFTSEWAEKVLRDA